MKIAVILTCYNRKEKTLSCLSSLFVALDTYNSGRTNEALECKVFLTDDGCTDGTAEDVLNHFGDRNILILNGDGSLYWAGGMRLAWNCALKELPSWDYYLLLNDDTDILPSLFFELFLTSRFGLEKFEKEGIVSGLTSAKSDHNIITYGGEVWVNKFTARYKKVTPAGKPVMCDMVNANILLVHRGVVDKMGIFYSGYRHGNADFDYSNHARRNGFPVLLTANVCGRCDDDHLSEKDFQEKIQKLSLKERIRFFKHPLHSSKDYLCYIKRNAPIRLPLVGIGLLLKIINPKLYYWLSNKR